MALTQKQRDELRKKYTSQQASSVDPTMDRLRKIAEQQTQQATDFVMESETEQPKEKGFFGRTIDRQKSLFSTIKGAVGRQLNLEQTPVETAAQIFGKAGTETINMGFDAITSVLSAITPDKVEKQLSDAIAPVFQTEAVQKALQAIDRGEEAYNEFKSNNPKDAATIEGIIGLAELATLAPAGARIGATKTAQRLAEASQARRTEKAVEAVVDIAKPKMTRAETKLAIDQGRVTRSTGVQKLFGVQDKVAADDRLRRAARTVVDEIADAENMTDVDLANAAKQKISDISKTVEPRLKQVELTADQSENAVASYIDKSKQYIELHDELTPSQIKRFNRTFENALLELSDAKNADDVWKIVQDYDSKIKDNIKQATKNATPETLARQEMWLENRRILRDLMDDVIAQADDDVATECRKMSDLYTIRENIINNADFFKGNSNYAKAIFRAGLTGAGLTGAGSLFLFD